MTIPTVPFFIQATGTTGDGAPFTVQTSNLTTPTAISVSLDRTQARLAAGASITVNATVSNAGSHTAFTLIAVVPKLGLVTASQNITVNANAQASFPLVITFPSTAGIAVAKFEVIVQDQATPSIVAGTYFTALRDGGL